MDNAYGSWSPDYLAPCWLAGADADHSSDGLPRDEPLPMGHFTHAQGAQVAGPLDAQPPPLLLPDWQHAWWLCGQPVAYSPFFPAVAQPGVQSGDFIGSFARAIASATPSWLLTCSSDHQYPLPMDVQGQHVAMQLPAYAMDRQCQHYAVGQHIEPADAHLQPRAQTPAPPLPATPGLDPLPGPDMHGGAAESADGGLSEPNDGPGKWLDSPPTSQNSGLGAAGAATASSVWTPEGDEQSIEDQIRGFCDPEKQQLLKPRLLVRELTADEAALVDQNTLAQTRRFPRLFPNAAAANAALASFQHLLQKPEAEVTTPLDDVTFPATDEAMVATVERVFDAISDWSHVLEWKSTLSRDAKRRFNKTLLNQGRPDPDSLRPTDEELRDMLPAIEVQQQRVLGQTPSDQTIEWISWGIVVRLRPGLVENTIDGGGRRLP